MRCKNCGWPNKPNVTTCVKCNSPLTLQNEDVNVANNVTSSQPSQPLSQTVREDVVFGNPNLHPGYAPEPGQAQPQATSQCPKCGYPLRAGSDKCPNCKFQLHSQSADSSSSYPSSRDAGMPNPSSSRRPTRMDSGEGNQNRFRGTINPYMMNMEVEPSFILKPLKRMEERHGFDEQEYEGKQVVLNRDNTEPNNPSITSRQQAIITNVDGRWFIEDKSDQKTTFVQAAKKIELHEGDIILLGNRLFEFRK